MQTTTEQNSEKKLTESTVAEETLSRAERDKRRSFYCRVGGNIIIGIALLIYTIVAWVEFADTKTNQTTVIKTEVVKKIEFPAIFFQMAEFGILNDVEVSYYRKTCDFKSASNPPTHITPKKLINPSTDTISKNEKYWLIINTTLSYYGYSGYGNYSLGSYNASEYEDIYYGYASSSSNYSYSYYRRLLSSSANTSYLDYNLSSYYSSPASNIYYILPPVSTFYAYTNSYKHCGDIFEIYFRTSVPQSAFKDLGLRDKFDLNLYIRAYPNSFGINYGYDSRAAVIDGYSDKGHIYYTGTLGFAQLKNEDLQLTLSNNKITNKKDYFYQSVATIDLTNIASNTTFYGSEDYFFQNYLYITFNDLVIKYNTVQDQSWTDVLSAIGGMYLTLSAPILIIIAMYLYGFSAGCFNFDGKAPLDPLPDDMLKRLDGYIAQQILDKHLAPGVEWAKQATVDTS